jgi:hypothetical protein
MARPSSALCPTPNMEHQVSVLVPQWQGGPVIPQAPGSRFVAFYDLQGYGGGILICLHTGKLIWFLHLIMCPLSQECQHYKFPVYILCLGSCNSDFGNLLYVGGHRHWCNYSSCLCHLMAVCWTEYQCHFMYIFRQQL